MSVADNMAFSLKMSGVDKQARMERVKEASLLLGLEDYLDRKPKALSGGQRQRVAMGRAIVRHPQVFCMDEPLSNLDAKLRVTTRSQIASLQQRLGITTVYVTHDQVEALTMGDRVAVLKDGVLQLVDTPLALYDSPANLFVAGFIGSPAMNLFPATVNEQGATFEDLTVPLTPSQRRELSADQVRIGVRPDGWEVGSGDGSASSLEATVEVVEELGTEAFVYAITERQTPVVTRAEGMTTIDKGDKISLVPKVESLHLFDETTGARLNA